MARKTTKTTETIETDKLQLSEEARLLMGLEVEMAEHSQHMEVAECHDVEVARRERFHVALAVFPQIVKLGCGNFFGPIGDENEAGTAARVAFEYADAFIAQSKKGVCDDQD